jgi:hypothetical protein
LKPVVPLVRSLKSVGLDCIPNFIIKDCSKISAPSTQPVTEMSTSVKGGRPAREAICEPVV